MLAQKYLDKLEQFTEIKAENAKALDEFSLNLVSYLNMLPINSHLNQLNNCKEIKILLVKLPFDMRKRFRTIVADLQSKNHDVNFVTFVQGQAEALKVPLFGDIIDRK